MVKLAPKISVRGAKTVTVFSPVKRDQRRGVGEITFFPRVK